MSLSPDDVERFPCTSSADIIDTMLAVGISSEIFECALRHVEREHYMVCLSTFDAVYRVDGDAWLLEKFLASPSAGSVINPVFERNVDQGIVPGDLGINS